VPPATVSKLLKQLQQHGLVNSTRGLRGGYRLARAPEHISAAQVLDALEGPMALTECSSHTSHCVIEHSCGVHRAWQRVNLAIRRTLADISLLELAGLAAQPIRFAALERLQLPARR
jgi:Rrf2 family protein